MGVPRDVGDRVPPQAQAQQPHIDDQHRAADEREG
jgi:hypothetical protein